MGPRIAEDRIRVDDIVAATARLMRPASTVAWAAFSFSAPKEGAMDAKRRTVTVEEFAQMVGLMPWAVRAGIRRGDIPCERIGRNVRIPLAAARAKWPATFADDAATSEPVGA
jgi:hypothetical protein